MVYDSYPHADAGKMHDLKNFSVTYLLVLEQRLLKWTHKLANYTVKMITVDV